MKASTSTKSEATAAQNWVFLFTRALQNEDPKTHVQVFGHPYGTYKHNLPALFTKPLPG